MSPVLAGGPSPLIARNGELTVAYWRYISSYDFLSRKLICKCLVCKMSQFCSALNVLIYVGVVVCNFVKEDLRYCVDGTLQWRHNGHHGVSNHQPYHCLLNRLFRRRSKKTSKLRVTGLCAGNSPRLVNSPHKWPVTRKMFPFNDVIMKYNMILLLLLAHGVKHTSLAPLGHRCFRWWLVVWMAPSHYLNQCSFIYQLSSFEHNLCEWNLIKQAIIIIENKVWNVVCSLPVVLSAGMF